MKGNVISGSIHWILVILLIYRCLLPQLGMVVDTEAVCMVVEDTVGDTAVACMVVATVSAIASAEINVPKREWKYV